MQMKVKNVFPQVETGSSLALKLCSESKGVLAGAGGRQAETLTFNTTLPPVSNSQEEVSFWE